MSDQLARVIRESGQPADVTEEQPLEVDVPPDRTRQFKHTGLSRMRSHWIGDDALALARLRAQADEELKTRFRVAYAVMDEVLKSVREPRVKDDGTGEVMTHLDGTPMWVEASPGVPEENWGRLSHAQRERLLYLITVHLFEWEQAAADLHAEAMYSKVEWEERFAGAFFSVPSTQISGRPTIDDKTQHGHQASAQERYFAVYCSELSRKADALIRSMTRIQRLLENATIR